jgi:hypothetical protein
MIACTDRVHDILRAVYLQVQAPYSAKFSTGLWCRIPGPVSIAPCHRQGRVASGHGSLGVRNLEFTFEGPEIGWSESGHSRAQWSTFWVDNHTTAEYWGMLDYDTVFVTAVTVNVRPCRRASVQADGQTDGRETDGVRLQLGLVLNAY